MKPAEITTTRWLMYSAMIISVCAVGFRGLPGQPWTYDDLEHIEKARGAQGNIHRAFSGDAKEPARLLLNLYFYLAYKIFGEAPVGYHTVNIVLHILSSLLCARLLLVLFKNSEFALLGGFLFAINGAPYEAVYKVSAAGVLLGQ